MTEETHKDIPLLQTFVALFILTAIEVGIGYLESTTFVVILLVLFAIAKASLIVAIFMHVAYEKEMTRIIIAVFVVPLIGVAILILTINSDWRVALGFA